MAEVTFGEWLKRQRGARGLTQEQLAQQVGCSTIALRKIEAEERRPSEQMAERLAEVFNILPAERQAFLKFARGDWRSAPTLIDDDAPWRAARISPRSNLPASTTALIGRDPDLAALHGYLADDHMRLVTLIGPPGIGKTRLSIAAAQTALIDFPDGVFFIALAPLDQGDLVVSTLVQTLGFIETGQRSALERAKDGIGDKRLLLVVDNVEHLIEGAAPLVSDLLNACPQLKILTTSREALRVPGEWLYPVPALDIPTITQLQSLDLDETSHYAALALFAERARAVRPGFILNADNIQTIASICTRLDGLPLAIELIAARLRLMSPSDLLARLSAPFVLSADGMRAVSARQKTLLGAIGWSYDLLSVEEQVLFARVSVFSGGFTLNAAEKIFSRTGFDKPVSDLVTALLDKSLLQRTNDERGELRFSQLVTIQQFALDRLCQTGEEGEVRNWHLAYFLDLAERADKECHGPQLADWLHRLEKEIDNLRAALDWCVSEQKTEVALRLLGALSWLWVTQGRESDLRIWFDKICALPEIGTHPTLYARLLNQIGRAGWVTCDFRGARSVLEESRTLCLTLGVAGEQHLAEALLHLGMVVRNSEADLRAAQSLLEQSLELFRKHGDPWGAAFALLNLGINALGQMDDAMALTLLEPSWDLFHQLDDAWGLARASQWLGQLYLRQGNYEKARLLFEQHFMIDEGLHFEPGIANALSDLGDLYRYQGDVERATEYYEKSLLLVREYGLKADWSYGVYALGVLALQKCDYALARKRFIAYFDLTWSLFQEASVCDILTNMAAVAAGTNQPERAARLHGAAQALFETMDYRIPPFDQAEFDRHLQIAREQLGDAIFEALAAEGRAISMEQAIELALQETN